MSTIVGNRQIKKQDAVIFQTVSNELVLYRVVANDEWKIRRDGPNKYKLFSVTADFGLRFSFYFVLTIERNSTFNYFSKLKKIIVYI